MKVDIFKDDQFKLWVVRIVDDEGNQVGDCEYAQLKREAKQVGKEMLQDIKNGSHSC